MFRFDDIIRPFGYGSRVTRNDCGNVTFMLQERVWPQTARDWIDNLMDLQRESLKVAFMPKNIWCVVVKKDIKRTHCIILHSSAMYNTNKDYKL